MGTVTASHIWLAEDGRAWIDDTNTKVIEVVYDYTGGWNAEQIHDQHPYLSLAQIHSALAYYFDHKQMLDDEMQRQREEVQRLRAQANAESPFLRRMQAEGKLP